VVAGRVASCWLGFAVKALPRHQHVSACMHVHPLYVYVCTHTHTQHSQWVYMHVHARARVGHGAGTGPRLPLALLQARHCAERDRQNQRASRGSEVHIHMCVYIYVCIYICVCTYIHIYVCIYICIYVYVYIYTYIHREGERGGGGRTVRVATLPSCAGTRTHMRRKIKKTLLYARFVGCVTPRESERERETERERERVY